VVAAAALAEAMAAAEAPASLPAAVAAAAAFAATAAAALTAVAAQAALTDAPALPIVSPAVESVAWPWRPHAAVATAPGGCKDPDHWCTDLYKVGGEVVGEGRGGIGEYASEGLADTGT